VIVRSFFERTGDEGMKKHSLLLFDLDNTLLGSSWFNEGLVKTIKIHPKTKDLDGEIFIEKMLNVSQELLEKFKKREITSQEFRRERWNQSIAYFNVLTDVELLDDLDKLFIKTSMESVTANKKIIDLLVELKSFYQLGIVTNGLYDARVKIKQMQLTHVFPDETIFDADQIGFRKPDPEIYLIAMKYFGKKPQETLFIGDSWFHDVVGPMKVGMDAIWVNEKGIFNKTTTHNPIAIVSDVLEIKQILLN
jgi:HAD superfamily hydrolase (TIGR01549 family)